MLSEFLAPFIAIGLAELGDKTQLALILLASRTNKRFQLLLGAFLGFLILDGIAIVLGSWVAATLPISIVKTASALIFIFFGILMLFSRKLEKAQGTLSHNPAISSFLLILFAEWGDKTQIAAGLFATQYSPLMVLAGTMSALTILSIVAVSAGGFISKRIDPKRTSTAAGLLFILFGILFLLV